MSYLGRGSNLTRKAQDKVSFLATAGQTVRTGLSYVPTHVDVTVNGITLTEITDYTATNGNSITFTVALALNDEVTIVSSKTFDVANHYTISAANALLAAKATNTAVAAKAPIASPVFTGNVGVGVTPEAWQSGWSALQIGGLTSYYAPTTTNASQSLMINNNAYNDGAWKYLITDEASSYYQLHGGHTFRVAPSGTADSAISWTNAMTINNAGIVTKPLQPIISVSRNNNGLSMSTNEDLFASTSMLNWVVQGITHNTSNGRFTVPVAGKYYIHFYSMKKDAVVAYFQVRKNGADTLGLRIYETSAQAGSIWHSYGLGGVFTLAANDYINVVCASGGTEVAHGQKHMNFTIQLVG